LAVVRGKREDYQDRQAGPLDIAILIEVAETSLDRDRGEKLLAYARSGVPVYGIVNLVDRRIEINTGPTSAGYQNRAILSSIEHVPVIIAEKEAGRIAVSDILPRTGSTGGTDPEQNR
jgi:hypothetical protein